ncbi:DUF418 domain-containing protein [Brevibacillus laterosporus]|uniref:DUF418 domain-containing protein n=1 Tax=Brevibacillus laterosporus TaxID=1465 RepID=UPI003D20A0F7
MNDFTQKDRIDTLDYLRGFALMGILLVNILALMKVQSVPVSSANAFIEHMLNFTVESRFFAIFSFLFGVGFYIFKSRSQAKGHKSTLLFIRRLLVLFAIGYLHQLLQPGEALFIYAIFGFVLLPFYRLSAKKNLLLSLFLLIPTSILGGKILVVFPLFLLGLAIGQYGVFRNIPDFMPKIKQWQMVSFILMIVGLFVQYVLLTKTASTDFDDSYIHALHNYSLCIVFVGLVMAVFYVTSIIRLLQQTTVQKWLAPLKYYGRMALTNYIGQTLIIIALRDLCNLSGKLGHLQTTLICLGIYALQMLASYLWLSIFTMGPLEWGWRVLTYGTFTPLIKRNSENASW